MPTHAGDGGVHDGVGQWQQRFGDDAVGVAEQITDAIGQDAGSAAVGGVEVPGLAALEPGRLSWTALLDVQRLARGADAATVTAVQLRQLLQRLTAARQWRPGDLDFLVAIDAGYDAHAGLAAA